MIILSPQNHRLLNFLQNVSSFSLPPLVTGSTGSGKTFMLTQLSKTNSSTHVPLIRCNQLTTSSTLQKNILDQLDKIDIHTYGPHAGYNSTLLLIDDVNMSTASLHPADQSPPVSCSQELLRQILSSRMIFSVSKKLSFQQLR